MSGLDEQFISIPECPKCKEIPKHWTLIGEGKSRVWVMSEKGARESYTYRDAKVQIGALVSCVPAVIDSIEEVFCPHCKVYFKELNYSTLVSYIKRLALMWERSFY